MNPLEYEAVLFAEDRREYFEDFNVDSFYACRIGYIGATLKMQDKVFSVGFKSFLGGVVFGVLTTFLMGCAPTWPHIGNNVTIEEIRIVGCSEHPSKCKKEV